MKYIMFQTNITVCVHIKSLQSCELYCATLWTVACQSPLSIGFSIQEYWRWVDISSFKGFSWPRLHLEAHYRSDFFNLKIKRTGRNFWREWNVYSIECAGDFMSMYLPSCSLNCMHLINMDFLYITTIQSGFKNFK